MKENNAGAEAREGEQEQAEGDSAECSATELEVPSFNPVEGAEEELPTDDEEVETWYRDHEKGLCFRQVVGEEEAGGEEREEEEVGKREDQEEEEARSKEDSEKVQEQEGGEEECGGVDADPVVDPDQAEVDGEIREEDVRSSEDEQKKQGPEGYRFLFKIIMCDSIGTIVWHALYVVGPQASCNSCGE